MVGEGSENCAMRLGDAGKIAAEFPESTCQL